MCRADLVYVCVAVQQLGLHWSLKKQRCDTTAMTEYVSSFAAETLIMALLGPFYGAIAVPSVTRCRRCCCCYCGHRFYIAIHQVSLLSHTACAIAGFGSSW